jgi:hypothetical protein
MTPRSPATNTGLAKVAVQCSADKFVANQSFVLSINIYSKNRQLLKPKTLAAGYNDYLQILIDR